MAWLPALVDMAERDASAGGRAGSVVPSDRELTSTMPSGKQAGVSASQTANKGCRPALSPPEVGSDGNGTRFAKFWPEPSPPAASTMTQVDGCKRVQRLADRKEAGPRLQTPDGSDLRKPRAVGSSPTRYVGKCAVV